MSRAGLNDVRRTLLVLGLLVGTSLLAHPAQGETVLTPHVGVRGGYDDNIFFTDDEDFESTTFLALNLVDNRERSWIKTSAEAAIYRYPKFNTYDRVDQAYSLDSYWDASERTRLSLSSAFTIDNSVDEILIEEGIVTEQTLRRTANVSPRARRQLSEISSLEVGYDFALADYDRASYFDYTSHGGRVLYRRELSDERTRALPEIRYSHVKARRDDPGATVSQDIVQASLGAERALNEILLLYGSLGFAYWTARLDDVSGNRETDHAGPIGNLGLRYTFERGDLSLEINRSIIQDISGESSFRNQVTGTVGRQLGERLEARLSGLYSHNETQGLIERSASNFFMVTPSLTSKLFKALTLTLSYTYSGLEQHDDGDMQSRNRIMLQLDWTPLRGLEL